jgi:methionyl aminopeptidase
VRKTKEEVAKMRRAGRVVAEMLDECQRAAKPGVTTLDLDKVARGVLERRGARSNFLNYHGFPAVICTSPNDVIVHGIPGSYRLKEGDILSVDCGAIIEGYHADAARTFPIGEVDEEALLLMDTTRNSLEAGIKHVRDGSRLSDIGHAVQTVAEGAGYSVVREYVGHGIGTSLHEEPKVPNYGQPGRGIKLKVGHVLAVEPMVNVGGPETAMFDDGWTVVTADGSLSAHFEDTIAVTEDGPEVLTVLD